MALPRVKIATLLERLVVGNALFNPFLEVGNGVDAGSGRCMGRFRNGKCIGLGTPDPECIFGKVKPANNWRGSNLVKPGNERAQLLHLDDVEGGVLIVTVRICTERNGTISRCVDGDEIGCIGDPGFLEACSENGNGSVCSGVDDGLI
jgi:hypothetical protein